MTTRHARHLAAWIAIFAMALVALVPTVSRTLARGDADPGSWVEICTVSGMQWVNLAANAAPDDGDDGQSQPARGAMAEHCAWCLLAGDRLGPASNTTARFWVPGDPVAPSVGLQPVFRSLAPLAAHARGPPPNATPPSVA